MGNNMMTVREAAELWQISSRRVQDLCRQGRVQGAVQFGKNWMIPADTKRPADGRGLKCREEIQPLPRRTPLLYMTNLYHTPGCAADASAGLQYHPEAKALFDGGIAYCRGDIDTAYACIEYLMERRSGFYGMTGAGLLMSFLAVWRGDESLWNDALHHIGHTPTKNDVDRELLTLLVAVANGGVRNYKTYPKWFDRGNLELLPADSHPAAKVFSARYLYAAAYSVAIRQMQYPGIEGLGLMGVVPYSIELMISQAVLDKTVIPEIHLRLWCATAYHNVGQRELAEAHIDRAIALALPDKLLGILAEHYRPLDGLLDERLSLVDPALAKTVREMHRVYFENQSLLSSRIINRNVAVNLTTREREIAKKAAFGMTNRAIAKALDISDSTVKTTIQNVMAKTGITHRDDFVLIL